MLYTFRPIFLLGLFFCLGFTHSGVQASDIRVFYAGFAFVGDYKNIRENYPHSFKISEQKNPDKSCVLESALFSRVSKQTNDNFKLICDQLGNLDQGEAISVAFALDNETVAVEKIGSDYKIVIDMGAQILFFDFKSMKVIGCYPIAIQLIDVSETQPDKDLIQNRIRELYTGNKYNLNIFDEFAKRLKDIEIKPMFSHSIQVTDVIVEEKAIEFLPEVYQSDLYNFKVFLAQNFSKFLSNNQQISVLPYTKGHAIGNKMATRFSNGEVYTLEIPKAQFETELTLRGFKKVLYDEKKSASSWLYGAYIKFKIFQPLLGKVYIDEKFKNAATKIVPSTQQNVDDWPAFQESLFVLFDSLTKKFSTERKFKPVKGLLAKCK